MPLAGRDRRHAHRDRGRSRISIHAPREGRDSGFNLSIGGKDNFNPRAPRGARRWRPSRRPLRATYFNPRAPCGARRRLTRSPVSGSVFQSTRPMRGATSTHNLFITRTCISIHAPHAGRDGMSRCSHPAQPSISIHAPHAGRDPAAPKQKALVLLISIHAPHAGRDRGMDLKSRLEWNFNPRAPCGARPTTSAQAHSHITFQSTRPMRGATCQQQSLAYTQIFQSTRPMRGATEQE